MLLRESAHLLGKQLLLVGEFKIHGGRGLRTVRS
jgi:hypothetical protein